MKTVKDMSKEVGVNPSTLYTLFYRGKLKGKRVETTKSSIFLDEQSVLEYFAGKTAVFTIMSSEEYAEELEREKEENNREDSFLSVVFVDSAEKNKTLLQAFAEIAKNKSRRFVIPLLPEGVAKAQLYQYIFTAATLILSKVGTEEMKAEVKIKIEGVDEANVKLAIKKAGFKNIEEETGKKLKTTTAVFKAIEKYAKKKKQGK